MSCDNFENTSLRYSIKNQYLLRCYIMEIYSVVIFFKHCSNSKKAVDGQIAIIYTSYCFEFNTPNCNYDALTYTLVTSFNLESYNTFTVMQVNYCALKYKY